MDGIMTTTEIAERLGDLKLPYLFTHRLIFRKGGIRRNPQKDWHVAIIDDASETVDEIVNLIYEDLNHLSIVTDRAEHFEHLTDTIYEETGLILHITDRIPAQANILLYMKP